MQYAMLNIIHDDNKFKRYSVLMEELQTQDITKYKIWDAVHSDTIIKSINLAHKQIVRWAKENELPFVTIAEDDIKFCDRGAYDYFVANVPDDYDLFLGGIFLGVIDEYNEVKEFTGLTLYRIANHFFDTFLSLPEDEHIDQALANKGKYVVCNPFTVTQHNGVSSQSNQYCNYDTFFTERKLFKQQI